MPRATSARYIGNEDRDPLTSSKYANPTYYTGSFFPGGNQMASAQGKYDPVKYAQVSNLKYIGTIPNRELGQSNYFPANNVVPGTPS